MNWKNVMSLEKPQEIDTMASRIYNYVRRSIKELTSTDEMTGESYTYFEYEELAVPKSEWGVFNQVQQNSADIDYLMAMSDIPM